MNIVAYGGGSNSRAMIIDMYHEGIKIDLILFADTGSEQDYTYEGNEEFNKWLGEKGLPKITVVKYIHGSGAYDTLEEECLQQNKLPSIAYGGIKSCSLKWKMTPQDKYCKTLPEIQEIWAKGERVNKYIGYDLGEEDRIDNAKKYDRVNKEYKNIYYLFDKGIDRDKCVELIKKEGMTLPGKSSCFFCPNMKTIEIIKMYLDYPKLFDKAVSMERNANLTKLKGLGRQWSWEELATTWQSVYDSRYGIALTGNNLDIAIKDCLDVTKEVMKDRRKQTVGQLSICDFMADDEDGTPCGCYDG